MGGSHTRPSPTVTCRRSWCKVVGAEVAQVYLTFPATAQEPPRQLKAFAKTTQLAPGDHSVLTFNIEERDLSVWDVSSRSWKAVTSDFIIEAGSSSRDIRLKGSVKMQAVDERDEMLRLMTNKVFV